MQTPSRVHHARNTSSDTEFVSNKTTKILKPPPRCHTQNIEDANIANTDDANSLMLHSAKKNTSSRLRIRIEQATKDFQAFLSIPRLIKPRMPIRLMGTKAPSNLQDHLSKNEDYKISPHCHTKQYRGTWLTWTTQSPSMATLCREHIANSSLTVNKRSSSLRLNALPRPRVKELTHINKTTNYLQVFTSMLYFPDA